MTQFYNELSVKLICVKIIGIDLEKKIEITNENVQKYFLM